MTRTDDVLNQIDSAVKDWTVSGDAMRSIPTAHHEEPPATPRLEVMGEDGQWQDVGVVTVEFHADTTAIETALSQVTAPPETATRIRETQDALHAFVRAYTEAVRPHVEAALRAFQAVGRALRDAGVVDEDGKPVKRRDRPAWQSPYGPPTRRH